MKLVIVAVFAVVAVAVAAPPQSNPQEPIAILRQDFEQSPEGSYNSAYETANGIAAQETGELKAVKDEDNNEQQVVVVRGSYSFADDQGKQHSVSYYADETGFHAESDDLPVGPPAARR
ncbi:hypothetical protein O0L34_g16333 [Tuta absoluta]|nr:hypothetical protein O0L34_g16333 [Tuta absoluta]